MVPEARGAPVRVVPECGAGSPVIGWGMAARAVTGLALVVALAGCTAADGPTPGPTTAPAPAASTVEVTEVVDVLGDLDVPWGLAFLPDGDAVVTLRDEATLVVVGPDGSATDVTGPGADELADLVVPGGEGGLLGVAVLGSSGSAVDLALYATAADDNRVLRGTLDGAVLGELRPILTGIEKAGNHNGGRLAVGPDELLYVTTGDAGDPPSSQDPDSLNGKILRITADGDPAPGNPDEGSPVWSLGHRNVQGLGWAPDGRMFASEFGQNTWDELNLIEPGGNYGWPEVEGMGEGFLEPVAVWPTTDASPSGLAVTDEGVYLAGLRGERLWRVPLTDDGVGTPQALLEGERGRLRAVEPAPDGSLWVVTGNTDGRGDRRDGDDRILRVVVD